MRAKMFKKFENYHIITAEVDLPDSFLDTQHSYLSDWREAGSDFRHAYIVGILRTLLRYKNWFVLNRLGLWSAGWDLTIDAKLINLYTEGAIVVFTMSFHE